MIDVSKMAGFLCLEGLGGAIFGLDLESPIRENCSVMDKAKIIGEKITGLKWTRK